MSLYLDRELAECWHRILTAMETLDADLEKLIEKGNHHAREMELKINITYSGAERYVVRMEDTWAVLEQVSDA